MDFRKVEFGKADAKEEGIEYPNLLINGYFDDSNILNTALNTSTFLFLGYKGSGKTALSEHIRLSKSSFNCIVNDILLSDFPYKSLNKIVSGQAEDEARLPLAWEWILLIYAIHSISQIEDNKILSNDTEQTLAALRKCGILPIENIRDFVTKSSKKSFKINIADHFQFLFEKGGDFPKNDELKFLHVVRFLKTLIESFNSDVHHYFIIDGLDEILTSREIQYKSIAALINQAKELNIYFRSVNINCKIIILCRTDIFERLPHPNKNKIRQDSSYKFEWFDESDVDYKNSNLIKIAQLRCNLVYPDIDLFKTFFPERFEGQVIYAALLNYTRHTPRDFMQLLKNLQKYTSRDIITAAEINKGLKSYSIDYFLPEIKDELVGYLDTEKVDSFFHVLSSMRKREFFLKDFIRQVETIFQTDIFNSESIFKVLFDCSAIGHVMGESNLKYFKYRNPNLTFIPQQKIILHKGLWKALTL